MIRNLIKKGVSALAIGAIIGLTGYGALALNVDQTRNTVARQNTTQQTSYYRISVNFNDPVISTGQKFGRLLQNTFISNVACHVTTAFNAGTTNVFTLGTSTASANEIINAATANQSINEASATYQQITAAGSLGVSVTSDADHDLIAKYTQTGTAATAGAVTCVIEFIPNNDM